MVGIHQEPCKVLCQTEQAALGLQVVPGKMLLLKKKSTLLHLKVHKSSQVYF